MNWLNSFTEDDTTTTSDGSNILCDSDAWSTIKGEWTYDDDDCTFENTDSRCGNIVWLGSDDGLTYDEDYDCDTFELTAVIEIDSGCSGDAGLMFRTGEASTTNDEGPTYYVGLYPGDDKVVFGTMDDGWSAKHTSYIDIDTDSLYTLTITGAGDTYSVYVDGIAVLEDIERTEFSSGSIGLRTYKAPSTYQSLSYSCSGTDKPTSDPTTSEPTAEPTTVEPTAFHTQDPTEAVTFVLCDSGKMTFEEAEECCNALGMHLASIHSDDEMDEAKDVCSGACWIGLHCMDNDQYDFEWTDGTSWDYTNWNSGEPNNWWNTNEDCVHTKSSGKWNDNTCSTNKKALCRVSGMYLGHLQLTIDFEVIIVSRSE